MKKFFIKIIKALILLISNFRNNQKILESLIVWLNIQIGNNAPVNNLMEVDFVRRFLNPNKKNLILDIGAFEGKYTDYLLKYYSESIFYLFEPSKNKFEFLKNKYSENSNCNIINAAVTDTTHPRILYSNNLTDSQSTLNYRVEAHRNKLFNFKEEVNCIKLSNFWKNELSLETIDLLKLDIEGEEFKVLFDIKDYLHKVNLIQFEFGEANIASRTFFKDIYEILESKSFSLFRYTSHKKLIEVNHYSEQLEYFRFTNYIAVNNDFEN